MRNSTVKQSKNKANFFKKEMNKVAGILFKKEKAMGELKSLFESYGVKGRNTFYSPWNTFRIFLRQVLSQDHSCRNAVSLAIAEAHAEGLRVVAPDTGNYCRARRNLPEELIKDLALELGQQQHLSAKSKWLWQNRHVKVIDGSTIDAPDTAKNQKAYPQPSSQPKGLGFPKIRLLAVMSLATASIVDLAFGKYAGKNAGEMSLLLKLMHHFKKGDVVLGYKYYGSYFIFAKLLAKGVDGLFPLHAGRDKGGFFNKLGDSSNDKMVAWVKPTRPDWMDLETYNKVPKWLLLREVKINGRYFVTTMLDRGQYSRFALGDLYKMRYSSIELDLRSIKDVMQLDFLRCQTPSMLKKEIWMHVLGYNLVRSLMNKAAYEFKKIPRKLSFKTAMQAVGAHCMSLIGTPKTIFNIAITGLLKIISFVKVGIRQRDPEPRAVKRRKKCLNLLTIPRKIAKMRLLKNGR